MPRILALDWERHEARYLLAVVHRGKVTVHTAGAIARGDASETLSGVATGLAELLKTELAGLQEKRLPVLAAISRTQLEVMELTVPPATDAELPELVANQAMRDSHLASQDWELDFVPLGENPAASRKVTAVAIPRDQLQRIFETCRAADLKLQRATPRHYAAAALYHRLQGPGEQPCLLVNVLADEADLTVVRRGAVAFSRTVRVSLAQDRPATIAALCTEINRTLLVAPHDDQGGDQFQSVCLFGREAEHADLADAIRRDLALRVTSLDLASFDSAVAWADVEHTGRYAALLGLLLEEAAGQPPPLDFCHPRKKPQPANRRRQLLIGAALLGCLASGAWYHVWSSLSAVEAENRQLSQRLQDLEELVKTAAEQEKLAAALSQWNAENVSWLDELRDLSLRLPSQRDAVVMRMSLRPSRDAAGEIEFQGLVRDPTIVVRMEQNVRDPYHEVRSKRVQQRGAEKVYAWHFETSVTVEKREKDKYLSPTPRPPADPERLAIPEAADSPPLAEIVPIETRDQP